MTVRNRLTRKQSIRKVAGMMLIASFLLFPLFIILFDPHASQINGAQSLCPHKLLTGLPCPGCGMIKSLVWLYQGDFLESIKAHLFGIPVALAMLLAFCGLLMEWITGKDFRPAWLFNVKWAYALAVVWGAYHLIRLAAFVSTHSFAQILSESIWK